MSDTLEEENERLRSYQAEYIRRHRALQVENDKLREAVEIAWGVIANAGNGDWTTQSPDWQRAAIRWRDEHLNPAVNREAARVCVCGHPALRHVGCGECESPDRPCCDEPECKCGAFEEKP